MKIIRKMGAAFMGAALLATSAAPAFAATSTATTNNTATSNDLQNADIIDMSKTGSLSIYKYDMKSAAADGVYKEGTNKATGEADTALQETMKNYAVEGVEFTYLRCGDVETCSVDNGTENFVELVFEVPDKLREILGLSPTKTVPTESINSSKDAVDMTAEKVSQKCDKSGVYHYTSQQLNDALADLLQSDDVAAKDALEGYVTSNNDAVQMPLTNDKGFTSATNLELGLYLLVETKVPEEVVETVNPWFVQLPFTNTSAQQMNGDSSYDKDSDKGGQQWLYDMTCYPKNQTGNPTLDKMVRNAYSNSVAYEDKNGTVSSASSYNGGTGFTKNRNIENTPIVHNIEPNVKSDDTDDSSYIANRGGYTEDGITAGDTKYSADYKYASTTTASEGDVLDYILVSKLPHISSTATYLSQYTFVDTLSEGIEYNQDARIAFYHTKEDAMANNTANADLIWSFNDKNNTYEQQYVDLLTDYNQATGQTSLTISFTENGLNIINGAEPDEIRKLGLTTPDGKEVTSLSDFYLVVYYTATVNSDATAVLGDEGNPNDVVLTWERTSQNFYNTLEDRCYVYTYGLDLTKTFSDSKGDPTKVQFTLYNETDAYYVIADKTETKDGELVYYVTGKTTSENEATKFSPDSSGAMIVNGIEGDKYQMTEIKTDDGYSLLKDQIVININTATREITSATCGYVGFVSGEKHDHTDDCYAKDANDNRITYTDSNGQKHEILICGHTDADANGRTIGKTDMKVADVVNSQTTVDDVSAEMLNYCIDANTQLSSTEIKSIINSVNGLVNMKVVNSKSFLLPRTGGDGMIFLAAAGVVIVIAGAYIIIKSRKNTENN